jgi:hypothetical protein
VLEQLHDVRLLFGSPYLDADVPASLPGDENEIVERNRMQQRSIARECAEWIGRKVEGEEAKVPRRGDREVKRGLTMRVKFNDLFKTVKYTLQK